MSASTGDRSIKLAYLSGITASSVVVMNIIGSYVSAMGAGLACPEWPLCPPIDNYLILLEFLHRAWGGVVSLLALATLVVAIKLKGNDLLLILSKKLVYLACSILSVQIILGAIVVYLALHPPTVALHQGLAMTILALFVASTTLSYASSKLKGLKDS